MIDRTTVDRLARLYDMRERLQCLIDATNKHFWRGVVNDAFGGTGTRSSLKEALGGEGELSLLLESAVAARIEQKMRDVEQQIIDLGAAP